jgi:hypothetical protein
MRNAYKILFGKPEEKRQLGRPRHRWVVNIRMKLREIGLEVVNSIHLGQVWNQWRAFVNSVMNIRFP